MSSTYREREPLWASAGVLPPVQPLSARFSRCFNNSVLTRRIFADCLFHFLTSSLHNWLYNSKLGRQHPKFSFRCLELFLNNNHEVSRVRRSPGHVDVDLLQVRLRMEEQKYNRIEVTVRRSQPSEDNNNLLVKIGNYDSEARKLKKISQSWVGANHIKLLYRIKEHSNHSPT